MVSLSPTEHPAMILMKICRHLVLKYSTKAAIVLMVADSTSCATFLLIFLSMANPTVRRSTHRASRRSSSPSSGPGKQNHAHRHCTTAQTSMLRSTSCPSARVSAGSGVETTSTSVRIRSQKKTLDDGVIYTGVSWSLRLRSSLHSSPSSRHISTRVPRLTFSSKSCSRTAACSAHPSTPRRSHS